MVTIALIAILVLIALAWLAPSLERTASLEAAFVRTSWIPLAALAAVAVFFEPLSRRLSYFVVAIPVLLCLFSLLLAVVGAKLTAAARRRGESSASLARATFVGAIPGALFVLYVVYAFVSHALASAGPP